ncbi:glycosyltransferase family 4 protein [Patescibacteria group bacterium]|nr:glycosyltransferase family 4 protein [Patescibacteria group bacterium]
MKIGIDYREAINEKKAGKGVVVYEWMEEFKKVVPGEWRVDLLVDEDFDNKGFPENFCIVIIGWPGLLWHLRVVWEVWWKYDAYLSLTSFIVPYFSFSKKCVVMVHDLVAFLGEFSSQHNKRAVMIEKALAKTAFKNAGKIIVPSTSTKDDLISLFGVDEQKVALIMEGVNKVGDLLDLAEIKKKYEIDGEYIFFVSTLEPRKNVERLIGAFGHLKKEYNWEGKLVVAGKKGWYFDDIFYNVRYFGLEDEVIFPGRIGDIEKFTLIKGAKCLCYPSLYEGFGLPVLEGMMMGVPVVTSNISSLPEVAGEAAVLVNPKDIDSIKEGIWKVLSDKKFAQDLVSKGNEQVKKFGWKKAAMELKELLITNEKVD